MVSGLKIPQLPADPGPALTDLLPLSNAVTTYKVTLQQISTFINANIPNLTGDVTSINFVTTISPNAVTTAKILNAAVTYAKIQNESATTLLGNPTGLSASPSEITLGAALAFVASSLQTLAMTGDITTAANSFVTTIANNAVTYAKFQQVAASSLVGNPTGALANSSAITIGATLSFVGASLQTLALTGAITSAANSFVTTLSNDVINTGNIVNGAVTYIKIQNVGASSLLGNPTGVGATVSEIILGTTLAFVANAIQTIAMSGDVTTSANSFVTTIANDAITTGKILNAAVTYAKIQNASATTLLGNPTALSASVGEITLGATITFVGSILQTLAFTGDVTSIANSFALTIANAAVTYAKIQNVAASRLLGNPTGGAASPSEITLGATLAFVGSALQTGVFSGDVTSAANSFALTVASIGGKAISLANSFTTSGNFAVTQTYTAATNVTFPTTGTLATLAGIETFTNKTITQTVNAQTGTTYTIVAADFRGRVTANNAAAQTYTLPQQSTLVTAAGVGVWIENIGTGTVTLIKEGAETLLGNSTLEAGATAFVFRTTTTSWSVFGGTAQTIFSFEKTFQAAAAGDVRYFTVNAPCGGTIIDCAQVAASLGTAGTYTVAIDGVNVTGLTTVTNTTTKTTTAASAANVFVYGSVITVTFASTIAAVNWEGTLRYTRAL